VCTEDGAPLAGYVLAGANQEHGIVARADGVDRGIAARLPVGTRLRILPNHACATAAQFPGYRAVLADGSLEGWPRFYGW
jgi:D-serine deaminase-like pyridoxal phosphate-dependent protein